MITPTFEEALRLRGQGNAIPIMKPVLADLLTPVSAFMKIAAHQDYAFLLESIEGGEKIARYSFLGCDPFLIVRSKKDTVELDYKFRKEEVQGNVIDILRNLLGKYKTAPVASLPPFTGGGVGYFAYEFARQLEDLPKKAADDLGLYDVVIMFYATLLAFDHVKHQILIISNIFHEEGENEQALAAKYGFALREIGHLQSQLNTPARPGASSPLAKRAGAPPLKVEFNLSERRYGEMVLKAKQYIKAGDIYQAVLSQRLEIETASEPLDIYRALRVINPSPYMFFLKLPDLAVTGASPEMLVRVTGRHIEYRPIAGTRPRGLSETEDKFLAEQLKNDEKERAEHLMLVDLGRNDLGKVCEYGSVRAKELMVVEKYSHVMHLVSALEGELRKGYDRFDALASCFPAGTVTGAPKVRAMQIIEELEPTRRSVYGGAIGYLDFSGNLDSCIALRTLIIKGGKAYIQAGGGIVADSTPEAEYQESLNKSQALLRALELAAGDLNA